MLDHEQLDKLSRWLVGTFDLVQGGNAGDPLHRVLRARAVIRRGMLRFMAPKDVNVFDLADLQRIPAADDPYMVIKLASHLFCIRVSRRTFLGSREAANL